MSSRQLEQMSALTQRQREILALIGQGLSTAEIAKHLCRTVKTVESHRLALGKKLGARNRVELALIANDAGLCGDSQSNTRLTAHDPESLRTSIRLDTPVDRALRAIDAATATTTGEEFFRALVSQLVFVFNTQCAYVLRLDSDGMLRSVAGWSQRGALSKFEFALTDSPCNAMDRAVVRSIPTELAQRFPQCWQAVGLEVQGMLVTPLHDSAGGRIGSLALLHDTNPPDSQLCPETVLRIFAGRVAAELERLRQVEYLRASEERFRMLMEHSNDMVSRLTPEGVFTYVSPASVQAMGFSPSDLIGQSALNFVHRDDRKRAEEALHSLHHDRDRLTIEIRRLGKDGAYRWFETSVHAHRDSKTGAIDWMTCTTRDIHERKMMEEQLRRQEAGLRRAQAVSQVGSWHLDIIANVLSWSDETYRIFGLPVGLSLTAEDFFARVHTDDVDRVDRAWRAALGGEGYDIEHRIIVGGAERWVREQAEIRFGRDGNPIEALGTVQDITRQKCMEQDLERRQIMLARAEDLAGIGGFEIDAGGKIVHGSSGFARMLGVAAEAIPCPLDGLINRAVHPDDRHLLLTAVDHSLSAGVSLNVRFRVVQQDESSIGLNATAEVIRDSTGQVSRLSGFIRHIQQSIEPNPSDIAA